MNKYFFPWFWHSAEHSLGLRDEDDVVADSDEPAQDGAWHMTDKYPQVSVYRLTLYGQIFSESHAYYF